MPRSANSDSRMKSAPRPRKPQERRTAHPNDAGAWSLLGFLYQLLGSASVSLQRRAVRAGELDADLVYIERHGQDLVRRSRRGIELVQFKHSEGQRDIAPAELANILQTFEKSTKALLRETRRTARVWALQTNRRLSPTAKAYRRGVIPRRVGDRVIARTIQRLNGKLRVKQHTVSDFREDLLRRARDFGETDAVRVAQRVIGFLHDLAQEPTGQRQIERRALDSVLAGFDGPRSINASDKECRMRLQEDLKHIATGLPGPDLADAISRPTVEDLLKEQSIALAVVYGPGGSGKTLSLLKALHDRIEEDDRLAAALMPGPFPAKRTLPELIASWRTTGHATPESLNGALERLRIANRDTKRPVLLLALDGIDEIAGTAAVTDDLLAYFMDLHQKTDQPDALLVVTCRTADQLDTLFPPLGTGGARLREVRRVALGDFTDDEFAEVWRRWFDEEPPDISGPTDATAALGRDATTSALSSRVRSALKHPVLLGCIKRLTPEERACFLKDEPEPWAKVLKAYVRWFSAKVKQRHGVDVETTQEILRAVAITTRDVGEAAIYQLVPHWIEPAQRHTDVPRSLLRRVFNDAATAGVLNVFDKRYSTSATLHVTWKWHLPGMIAHLCEHSILDQQ